METKICSKCGEEKMLSEFHKDLNTEDGLRIYCKECIKENNRKYYKSNPEKVKKRAKKWQTANPDKLKEIRIKWYKANTEKANDLSRKWYKVNAERVKENNRKWQENNPEKVKEKNQTKKRAYHKIRLRRLYHLQSIIYFNEVNNIKTNNELLFHKFNVLKLKF